MTSQGHTVSTWWRGFQPGGLAPGPTLRATRQCRLDASLLQNFGNGSRILCPCDRARDRTTISKTVLQIPPCSDLRATECRRKSKYEVLIIAVLADEEIKGREATHCCPTQKLMKATSSHLSQFPAHFTSGDENGT